VPAAAVARWVSRPGVHRTGSCVRRLQVYTASRWRGSLRWFGSMDRGGFEWSSGAASPPTHPPPLSPLSPPPSLPVERDRDRETERQREIGARAGLRREREGGRERKEREHTHPSPAIPRLQGAVPGPPSTHVRVAPLLKYPSRRTLLEAVCVLACVRARGVWTLEEEEVSPNSCEIRIARRSQIAHTEHAKAHPFHRDNL
jgi:hypothetical protein